MSSNSNNKGCSQPGKNQKSVSIITNGCLECRMDCAELDRFFQETLGYRLCKDPKEADIIVFKGCGVNQEKEDLSCQIIKAIEHNKRPDAQILITGCITKIRSELADNSKELKELGDKINRLSRFENGHNLKANRPHPEFWQLSDGFIDASISNDLISKYCHRNPESWLLGIYPKLHAGLIRLFAKYRRLIDKEMLLSKRTFCIKVSTGCMGKCSYCAIKLARGGLKSKPVDVVLEEFERGLDEGFSDFALVGTDIGDYGKDLGIDLLYLLQKIVSRKEKFKLRLRNVNPRWLIPSAEQFCELLKTGKIAYILSPVESGSNHILERMNRGYRIEDYVEAIRKIRKAYPSILIKTQIMVGFPGETDEDFNDSRSLFQLGLFDYIEVYAYTKRPNTKAFNLSDEVPEEIINKRYRELLLKSFFYLPVKRWLSICMLKIR